MSHNITYPQSIEHDLSCCQVRENEDDYGNSELGTSILKLVNLITDRLVRADALTDLLRMAENPPEHSPNHRHDVAGPHQRSAGGE